MAAQPDIAYIRGLVGSLNALVEDDKLLNGANAQNALELSTKLVQSLENPAVTTFTQMLGVSFLLAVSRDTQLQLRVMIVKGRCPALCMYEMRNDLTPNFSKAAEERDVGICMISTCDGRRGLVVVLSRFTTQMDVFR